MPTPEEMSTPGDVPFDSLYDYQKGVQRVRENVCTDAEEYWTEAADALWDTMILADLAQAALSQLEVCDKILAKNSQRTAAISSLKSHLNTTYL